MLGQSKSKYKTLTLRIQIQSNLFWIIPYWMGETIVNINRDLDMLIYKHLLMNGMDYATNYFSFYDRTIQLLS